MLGISRPSKYCLPWKLTYTSLPKPPALEGISTRSDKTRNPLRPNSKRASEAVKAWRIPQEHLESEVSAEACAHVTVSGDVPPQRRPLSAAKAYGRICSDCTKEGLDGEGAEPRGGWGALLTPLKATSPAQTGLPGLCRSRVHYFHKEMGRTEADRS